MSATTNAIAKILNLMGQVLQVHRVINHPVQNPNEVDIERDVKFRRSAVNTFSHKCRPTCIRISVGDFQK